MSFDFAIEDDPHEECRHEIHRLQAENDRLKLELDNLKDQQIIRKAILNTANITITNLVAEKDALRKRCEQLEKACHEILEYAYQPKPREEWHLNMEKALQIIRLALRENQSQQVKETSE